MSAVQRIRLGDVQRACLEQAADACDAAAEIDDGECDWALAASAMRSLRFGGEFQIVAGGALLYALNDWANNLDEDMARADTGEDRVVIRDMQRAVASLWVRLRRLQTQVCHRITSGEGGTWPSV